jgi:hypothetical protein
MRRRYGSGCRSVVPAALDVTDDVTVTISDGSYGATVSLPPRAGAGN